MKTFGKYLNPYRPLALIATTIMIIVLALDAMSHAPAAAQVPGGWFAQQQVLKASAYQNAASFGANVALDGTTAAIVAGTGDNPDTVYVMDLINGQWEEQQQLKVTEGETQLPLGFSLGLSGDTILASDLTYNNAAGAAYLFTRENGLWTEKQMLIPADSAQQQFFGWSLALDGDTAIVGAPGDDADEPEGSNQQGAAYVFTKQNGVWTQTQKLSYPDTDLFGISVALQNNTAMIGTGEDNKVYVFEKVGSTWIETQILSASDVNESSFYLGYGIALDDDVAMISTFGFPSDSPSVVYVFHKQNGLWTEVQKLAPSDRATPSTDSFGSSMALQGDLALISDSQNGWTYPFAYINGQWREQPKLPVENESYGSRLGGSLALENSVALVDGRECDRDEENPNCLNAVYVFNYFEPLETATPLSPTMTPVTPSSTPVAPTETPIPSTGTAIPPTETPIAPTSTSSPTETSLPPSATGTQPAPSVTPTLTLTSTPPSDNQTELLVNGGFELNADGDQSPDGWKLKQESGDKLKCNDGSEAIAYEGLCAFQFKGGDDERSKLQQDVDLTTYPVSAGDTLTLDGHVWAKGDVDSKVTLKVKYATLPTAKLVVDVNSTGKQWTAFSALQTTLSLVITDTPIEITLQIKHASQSGKVRYDALRLIQQSNSLVPLGVPQ